MSDQSKIKLDPNTSVSSSNDSSVNINPESKTKEDASEIVEESEWVEHTSVLDDNKPYYFNVKTKESTWVKPTLFKSNPKKMRPISAEKLNVEGLGNWRRVLTNTGHVFYFNLKTKTSSWAFPKPGKDDVGKRKREDDEEDSPSKKIKIEGEEDDEDESDEEENLEESENKEEELTFAQRVEVFRQMLKEKNLLPFGTWERELPKFAFDPRFKILPDVNDRRQVFDDFVKNKMEEERKDKRDRYVTAKEFIQKFMKENPNRINDKTSFDDFKQIFGTEVAFRNLVSKEKEKVFDELVGPLKKASKEKEALEREKAKKDFIQMLKEVPDLSVNSSWNKVKPIIKEDERFNAPILSDSDKQDIFNEYLTKLEEMEKRREEAKKEREREVKKEKEKMEQEAKKAFQKVAEKEVEIAFKTMLKEKVKDPEASWTKTKKYLESDPRFNSRGLSYNEKENLFREHLKNLQLQKQEEFKNLLKEASDKSLFDIGAKDYESIKKHIQDDPRYEVLGRDERRQVFERFMKEWKKDAFNDLKELLRESKNLGMITSKTPSSGQQYEYVHQLLQKDKRYANLHALKEERDKAMKEFIENLRKGTE